MRVLGTARALSTRLTNVRDAQNEWNISRLEGALDFFEKMAWF
jgi:hypothetical protein